VKTVARERGALVPYPSNVVAYSTGTVQLTWKGLTREQYDSLLEVLDWWAEKAELPREHVTDGECWCGPRVVHVEARP
jgi:hypothetical protein